TATSAISTRSLRDALPISGEAIDIYTLTSTTGIKVKIMTYGATIVSLEVPGKDGLLTDVTLGFDNLADYEQNRVFFGATIGRFRSEEHTSELQSRENLVCR